MSAESDRLLIVDTAAAATQRDGRSRALPALALLTSFAFVATMFVVGTQRVPRAVGKTGYVGDARLVSRYTKTAITMANLTQYNIDCDEFDDDTVYTGAASACGEPDSADFCRTDCNEVRRRTSRRESPKPDQGVYAVVVAAAAVLRRCASSAAASALLLPVSPFALASLYEPRSVLPTPPL